MCTVCMCALYVCDVHLVCVDRGGSSIYTVVSGRVNCVGVVDTVQWEGI